MAPSKLTSGEAEAHLLAHHDRMPPIIRDRQELFGWVAQLVHLVRESERKRDVRSHKPGCADAEGDGYVCAVEGCYVPEPERGPHSNYADALEKYREATTAMRGERTNEAAGAAEATCLHLDRKCRSWKECAERTAKTSAARAADALYRASPNELAAAGIAAPIPAPRASCAWCRGNPIGMCTICQSPPSTPETYADGGGRGDE